MRLAEAVRVTPPPLWFVLILGALLTVGWIVLRRKPTPRAWR